MAVDFTRSVAQGTNRVLLVTPSALESGLPAYYTAPAEVPTNWTLSGAWDAPYVASAEMDATATRVVLTTDRPLREGVTYTVTPAAVVVLVSGSTALNPATVSGIVVPGASPGSPDRRLVDVASEPTRGLVYRGHDLANTAGGETLRTVARRIIWTTRGTLPWAPGFGADSGFKRPRPADLALWAASVRRQLEAIDGVTRASVRPVYQSHEMQVFWDLYVDDDILSGVD